jgi:4-amino-4-deoxy-L-arabinose transferase-like glycosyltransferase
LQSIRYGIVHGALGEDLSVATVGVALLLACGVAAADLARSFGASERRALLAGALLLATPAVQSTALTGYSDVWAVATLLLGTPVEYYFAYGVKR